MAEQKLQTQPGWKTIPIGGLILTPGNACTYKTGEWGVFKPVWNSKTCIQCMICWVNCPDASILVKDGKVIGIDYEHCKGCGICAQVCPTKPKSINMEKK
jgi:pyruvate ferredoxin oxidoreductase delta subunit